MYQSQKDKLKLICIILSLVITLVLGIVGVILANVGQLLQKPSFETVGFVLMGVGLGGFFVVIVMMLLVSLIKNRKNK